MSVPEKGELAYELVLGIVGSPILAKACYDDSWVYKLKLTTGEVILFNGATVIDKEWIHLHGECVSHLPGSACLKIPPWGGMDIRISSIVWVHDHDNDSDAISDAI